MIRYVAKFRCVNIEEWEWVTIDVLSKNYQTLISWIYENYIGEFYNNEKTGKRIINKTLLVYGNSEVQVTLLTKNNEEPRAKHCINFRN